MLLEGRIALVTGSGRGIGAATAKLMALNGAAVAVNYNKNLQTAENVVKEINNFGGKAILIQADVTDMTQVERLFNEAENKLGKIDTLVLNAGINFIPTPFMDIKWEDFEHKYVGEMKASYFPCKCAIPSMLEKKNGCIIVVSSGLSRRAGTGFIAHSTAKAALNAFVKSLATELSPQGIRINAIAPGLTLTDAIGWMPPERLEATSKMVPLQRVGLPEDMAGAILFLASDYGKFITGGYIPVDGGMTML